MWGGWGRLLGAGGGRWRAGEGAGACCKRDGACEGRHGLPRAPHARCLPGVLISACKPADRALQPLNIALAAAIVLSGPGSAVGNMALAPCTPIRAAAGTVSTHRRSVGPAALADTAACRPAAAAATAAHGRQRRAWQQHVGRPPAARGTRQLTCSSYRTNPQNVDNPQASRTFFSWCGRSIFRPPDHLHALERPLRAVTVV